MELMGWRWCGLKLINFVLEKIICRLWSDSQVVMSVSSKSICFLKLKSFLQGITSDTSSANNVEGPSSSFGKSFMYSKKYTFENATLEDRLCYYFFTWSYSTYVARCKVAMLHLNALQAICKVGRKPILGGFSGQWRIISLKGFDLFEMFALLMSHKAPMAFFVIYLV